MVIQALDPSDPHYLHPCDHPGLVLVTPPFDGKNYGEWRRSIRIALSAKNKVRFIDGTLARPDKTSDKFHLRKRCNDTVIS